MTSPFIIEKFEPIFECYHYMSYSYIVGVHLKVTVYVAVGLTEHFEGTKVVQSTHKRAKIDTYIHQTKYK